MNDRGGTDLRISSDFEDIIYVLDNRVELIQDLENAANDVFDFLRFECLKLLSRKTIFEEIACVMPYNSDDDRIGFVFDRIKQILKVHN